MAYYKHTCVHYTKELVLQDEHLRRKILCPHCEGKSFAPAYLKAVDITDTSQIIEVKYFEETISCHACQKTISKSLDTCSHCGASQRLSETMDYKDDTGRSDIFKHIVCGWPLLLCLIGGLVGGICGAIGYMMNLKVYASPMPHKTKLRLNYFIGISCIILWIIIASSIQELINKN